MEQAALEQLYPDMFLARDPTAAATQADPKSTHGDDEDQPALEE